MRTAAARRSRVSRTPRVTGRTRGHDEDEEVDEEDGVRDTASELMQEMFVPILTRLISCNKFNTK